MKYVIIGNSAAGIAAAEAIRENDSAGEVLIISSEPYCAYSRPLISYLVAGKVSRETMYYRDKEFYKTNRIETKLGEPVKKILPGERAVLMEGGEKIKYDRLLISTGGKPFVPPFKGADLKRVFTFTAWKDAEDLLEVIDDVHRAVVIGAGMIGIKAVEGLIAHNIDVTIVELADRVLAMAMDKDASRIVQKQIEREGVTVITSSEVVEILGHKGSVNGVKLQDGSTIECDLVIVAIGVIPNTDIVKETGIKTNRGILVDSTMQTSVQDIYAAGDVAEGYDLLIDADRAIPIWPVAYRQGKVAGSNMSGTRVEYEGGVAKNSIEFVHLPTISGGLATADGEGYEVLKRIDDERSVYAKIVIKDGVIVGASFIGEIEKAGVILGLMTEKINVEDFKDKLLRPDFGFASLPEELRKQKISRVV